MVDRRCVGAGFYPARGVVQNRREGQSPSPTNGFTKVQTKIVSPSVKTEGFDTSASRRYAQPSVSTGPPRRGRQGNGLPRQCEHWLAMTPLGGDGRTGTGGKSKRKIKKFLEELDVCVQLFLFFAQGQNQNERGI